jgi:hypothetical protein
LDGQIPALAVLAGAAGQPHFEPQTGRFPGLVAPAADKLDVEGLEEILGGIMVPVGILNPPKEGELVVRTHVKLERFHPGPLAVVHTLGVMPIALTARLPVSFEE